MRALRGGIPRALPDHRTANGVQYGRYCRAVVKRLGKLGRDAMPTLEEAGLAVLDLRRLRVEIAAAQARPNRRREVRRLERDRGRLRRQLLDLERRLEELATRDGRGASSLAQYLAAKRATAAAGGTP